MKHLNKIYFFLIISFLFTKAFSQTPKVYKNPIYDDNWSKPTVHPSHIMLNLGENPANTMSVTWRTDGSVKNAYAEIAKATAAPKFWRTSTRYHALTEALDASKIELINYKINYHSVTFKNLDPDTTYGYRVGDGAHWSEWIQFKTAKTSAGKFTFLYMGDVQNNILELWSRVVREGFKKAPNARFIVYAGDMVETGQNDKQWHEWFKAGDWIHSMVPAFPVPGNHEYKTDKKKERKLAIQWKHQFTLPENGPDGVKESAYYSDYQNVRIIGLNSMEKQKEQAIWLEEVLKYNPNKWTVITFHYPIYSSSAGRDNKRWRDLLKPIFDKYKVDLVLQGHDHTYARGGENNMTTGVSKTDKKTGTVYVVSVSGGKMYNHKPNWDNYEANRSRLGENTQLFQTITVDGDKLAFESYTPLGELYDAFVLVKNDDGPNSIIDMSDRAVQERYHSNTISYYDKLPRDIEHEILKQNPGFLIDQVRLYENKEKAVLYNVRLRKKEEVINLVLDKTGNVLEKK
ncbi:purple acid phosphatase family protein [Algibacter pacificus]|uniref:purple acid phosphatase family protein n=1 Tax=Algibacter pacificus TaxID=2599389 RepID=UPI0011C6F5F2|nr:metallophosphoesterase family protein [Algibacter pacificus]